MFDREACLLAREPARFEEPDFHDLMRHAKAIGASDLHIKSSDIIRARVHGRLVAITRRRLEHAETAYLARMLYGADNAELEIQSGKPLDDAYVLKLTDEGRRASLRFRWNASACESRGGFGIKLTLRELPEEPPRLPLEDLPENVIENLFPDEGMSLICGATGSGKTTFLAGVIRLRGEDPEADCAIETLEAPIEFVFDKIQRSPSCIITQRSVPKDLQTFAQGVVNAMRTDPDMIVVGEMRDQATIEAALMASTTGHLVWSTVHAYSVGVVFRRLASVLGGADSAAIIAGIIDACRIVICQSLYPSTDGKRVAVRETLVFNEEIRATLIRAAASNLAGLPLVAQGQVGKFGQSKLQHAQELVRQGRLDERYLGLIVAEAARLEGSLVGGDECPE